MVELDGKYYKKVSGRVAPTAVLHDMENKGGLTHPLLTQTCATVLWYELCHCDGQACWRRRRVPFVRGQDCDGSVQRACNANHAGQSTDLCVY